MKRGVSLLEGNIKRLLLNLSLPSIGGMLTIVIYNLTDTYFVSLLGMKPLAAMGFTFPIVMIIGSISSGMALGAGSVMARAMGKGEHHKMERAATDGILLAVLLVVVISLTGIFTMDFLFGLLGAKGGTLQLVKQYMFIWYCGSVAAIMPPVGDACMRGMGDMKRPLLVMLVCAVTNLILDPILIFGYFGLPAMGIQGAAIATVVSRAMGMVLTLSFIHFHYKLINFKFESIKELLSSWKEIVLIGVPGATIRLCPQVIRAIITNLAFSVGGVSAVAAIAAATKIESFMTIISMAIGTAIVPMVGQNWGAQKYDRVNEVRKATNRLSVIYGVILFGVMLLTGGGLAQVFSDDITVINYTRIYVYIISIGTIGLNLYNWTSQSLNASGQPKWVWIINIAGSLAILIPAIYAGVYIGGYTGMLAGLALGQCALGVIAVWVGKRMLGDIKAKTGLPNAYELK